MIHKTQRYSFLSTSSNYQVSMRVDCASPSLTASSCGIENSQLLQYGHAYQLSICANLKTMDARVCILARTKEWC